MALRTTLENLKQMIDDNQKERALQKIVHTGVCPPEDILDDLQRDIRNNQTEFTYTIASYPRIYHQFGEQLARGAILAMATKYRDTHFPTGSLTITDWDTYNQTEIVDVLLHLSLPSLSIQMNSHLPPT